MRPEEYNPDFYTFGQYVSKHRFLTFWYQIKEITSLNPSSVLEIGVGPGVVTPYLRYKGIDVTTVDINPSLNPDVVGSVLDLDKKFEFSEFDLVLCSRVLHHLPFNSFQKAIQQIEFVTRYHAVLSLPIDDLSFYIIFRYTSSNFKTYSLRLPLLLKRILFRNKYKQNKKRFNSLWKINDSSETLHKNIDQIISEYFLIGSQYCIPEDSAHLIYTLSKRSI